MATLAPPYAPRRPTETVLYRVVRESLDTFVAHARETYERPLPRYVENELRAYLRCGVFSHGFIRCHCDACGHDLLVAFSCKGRGVCPSCAGRRMANSGAHLVDRVVPDVPVRQFVLSLPHELRMLAAFKPDVLTALSRIFVVRFHGVLGPRSSWRKDVVPKPRGAVVCTRDETKQRKPRPPRGGRGDGGQAAPPGRAIADPRDIATPAATSPGTTASIAPSPPPSLPESSRAETPTALATQPLTPAKATFVAPNVLSIAHWNRLAGGELYAATPRMAWGPLLRRTFAVDVQECPKCHGRLRLIAAIIDPPVARAILASLGMPSTAPVPSRARDPTELFELEPSEPCAP